MIRTLALIAGAGAVVSAVCLGVAAAITGPAAIAHGAWSWGPAHGDGPLTWRFNSPEADEGPSGRREMPWTGGSELTVGIPADVRYAETGSASSVVVTGPKAALDDLDLKDGRLSYRRDHDHGGTLTIVISAPGINRFTLESRGDLEIAAYHQDHLTLRVEGQGDVKASGEAQDADLVVEGSGDADLGALKLQSVRVQIQGSGDARIAPAKAAAVDISGSGDVTLLSDPPKLETHVSGSGEVRRESSV